MKDRKEVGVIWTSWTLGQTLAGSVVPGDPELGGGTAIGDHVFGKTE